MTSSGEAPTLQGGGWGTAEGWLLQGWTASFRSPGLGDRWMDGRTGGWLAAACSAGLPVAADLPGLGLSWVPQGTPSGGCT